MALLCAGCLALSACGEGGGAILTPPDDDDNPPPTACTSTTCGQVRIGLTDADGDFLSYAVDVVSIKLERSNGATVETLPNRQRVDFADLVDVTEFVTAADVPTGTYVGATIRLDYSEAAVSVEVGGAPAEAVVLDENGDSLETVDVELQLDNANRVVVAPGTPALLQLDFDLAATHDVNFGAVPVTVTADPVLVASIAPVDAREFRLRGPLVSVDEAAGSYVVDLRPFNHRSARLGELTVLTTPDSAFEVDGAALDQDAGLAALADLGEDTPTVAHGTYDTAARTFTADRVLAGDSVPGAELDVVIGNVAARDGNELIVSGGTVIRPDDEDDPVVFVRGDITVTIGADTAVTKDGGSGTALTTDAISVGQRIQAFGEASTSDLDPTLDARDGRVRLLRTHVAGDVVDTTPGQLTLELFSVDGKDPVAFDFTGTGGSILTDANPLEYQVDSGALDLDDFEVGDPAQVFGFATPFGEAPPDFAGETLVNFDDLRALLGVGWGLGGTDAPFMSMGQDGFVIDVTNPDLGARRFLKIGARAFDISQDLPEPITVEPAASGRTLYAIARRLRVEMFTDFGDFATRVNSLLNGGSSLRSFTARGSFDRDETTLTANYVAVSFAAQ